jgi:hypothetical protein
MYGWCKIFNAQLIFSEIVKIRLEIYIEVLKKIFYILAVMHIVHHFLRKKNLSFILEIQYHHCSYDRRIERLFLN